MTTKPISILYDDNLRKVKIIYTFNYNRRNYAFVSLDENNEELRILRIKYSVSVGMYANSFVTDDEILEAGEAVCDTIKQSEASFNGEHYSVKKNNGVFEVKIEGKLRRFNPFFQFVTAFLALLVSFGISGGVWYCYFAFPHDWIRYLTDSRSKLIIGLSSYIFMCMAITAEAVYQRIKCRGSGCGFATSLLLPPVMAFCFGFVSRASVRLITLGSAALIAGAFIFNVLRIRKMNGKKAKKASLDRLFSLTKLATVCACTVAVLYSIVSGYVSPYRRHNHPGFVDKAILEKQHVAACEKIENTNWQDMSESDKIELLQTIIDYNTMQNGSFSAKLVPADLNSQLDSGITYGAYDDEFNRIFIDKEYALNNATDSIQTVLHESRHTIQDYVANHEEKAENKLLAEAFKKNLDNYNTADHYKPDRYYSQLCEVDSRYYVKEHLNEYLEHIPASDYESSDYSKYLESEEYVIKAFVSNDEWDYALCHPYENGDDHSQDYIELCRFTGESTESIVLPSMIDSLPVKSLSDNLFYYVKKTIGKVVVPSIISSISCSAFDNCEKLTVEISDGNRNYKMIDDVMLVSMKDGTLQWVDKKTTGKVVIPENITSIAWDAFTGCKKITEVEIKKGNRRYFSDNSGLIYNKETKALVLCPEGKEGVVKLADNCTAIRREAFSRCSLITEIIITDSVREIEEEAFDGCSSLLRLTIPKTVEKVSAYALSGLKNIERLSISGKSSFVKTDSAEENCLILATNRSLKDIFFDGTQSEWKSAMNVNFNEGWGNLFRIGRIVMIHCSDGEISEEV